MGVNPMTASASVDKIIMPRHRAKNCPPRGTAVQAGPPRADDGTTGVRLRGGFAAGTSALCPDGVVRVVERADGFGWVRFTDGSRAQDTALSPAPTSRATSTPVRCRSTSAAWRAE
jgi:hypothetical protein